MGFGFITIWHQVLSWICSTSRLLVVEEDFTDWSYQCTIPFFPLHLEKRHLIGDHAHGMMDLERVKCGRLRQRGAQHCQLACHYQGQAEAVDRGGRVGGAPLAVLSE